MHVSCLRVFLLALARLFVRLPACSFACSLARYLRCVLACLLACLTVRMCAFLLACSTTCTLACSRACLPACLLSCLSVSLRCACAPRALRCGLVPPWDAINLVGGMMKAWSLRSTLQHTALPSQHVQRLLSSFAFAVRVVRDVPRAGRSRQSDGPRGPLRRGRHRDGRRLLPSPHRWDSIVRKPSIPPSFRTA